MSLTQVEVSHPRRYLPDLDIDRTCLQEAIKQVGDMRTVTGIAAGVWGQLLTAEPAIVDEIIREKISNSMPAAVRDLLTGVHYRVLGYDDSAKRRPVGSLDAIVKVAQVYLLKAEQASIAEVSRFRGRCSTTRWALRTGWQRSSRP